MLIHDQVDSPHHNNNAPKPPNTQPVSDTFSSIPDQTLDYFSSKPTFRVYTKAETNCSLTIRDDQVILARFDLSDPFQVQLIPYVPDILDESVLWTLSADLGDGYRAMRMATNAHLNVDAFQDSNGCVHDGTIIGLWEWLQGENQQWKIVPHQDGPSSIHNETHQVWDYLGRMPSVRVYTKAETNCSLAIRHGKVILARADPSDPSQHWVKDEKYSTKVQLIPYVPGVLDESVLWTVSEDLGDGYRAIRMSSNTRLSVDAFKNSKGRIHDGTIIGLWEWLKGENQRWKIVPHEYVPSSIRNHTHQVWDCLSQMPSVRVCTKAETNCSLAVRDGEVILARADPSDMSQVQLIPYGLDVVDEPVLWTLGADLGDGYRATRMVNNTRLNLDAFLNSDGRVDDGTIIGL